MDTTTKSPPAADRAYTHVKRAILDRTYEGGTLLTEGEVADEVGVSRTPVREALLRLQSEGLLRLYPKRGALVLSVSAKDVEDILEARALVETFTAGRAYRRKDALADALEPLLAEMSRHQRAGDPHALSEVDRGFHATIVAAAGNGALTQFYEGLRDRQLCMGEKAMRQDPAWMAEAVSDHATILQALRDGDAERFEHAVSEHISTAGERLRRIR